MYVYDPYLSERGIGESSDEGEDLEWDLNQALWSSTGQACVADIGSGIQQDIWAKLTAGQAADIRIVADIWAKLTAGQAAGIRTDSRVVNILVE